MSIEIEPMDCQKLYNRYYLLFLLGVLKRTAWEELPVISNKSEEQRRKTIQETVATLNTYLGTDSYFRQGAEYLQRLGNEPYIVCAWDHEYVYYCTEEWFKRSPL